MYERKRQHVCSPTLLWKLNCTQRRHKSPLSQPSVVIDTFTCSKNTLKSNRYLPALLPHILVCKYSFVTRFSPKRFTHAWIQTLVKVRQRIATTVETVCFCDSILTRYKRHKAIGATFFTSKLFTTKQCNIIWRLSYLNGKDAAEDETINLILYMFEITNIGFWSKSNTPSLNRFEPLQAEQENPTEKSIYISSVSHNWQDNTKTLDISSRRREACKAFNRFQLW